MASEAAAQRQTHRLTEDEFSGAINLSFPDIAIASLAKMLPGPLLDVSKTKIDLVPLAPQRGERGQG